MSGGNLEKVLRTMAEKKGSDLFLSANTPILIKVNGHIRQLTEQVLTPAQPKQLLAEMLTPEQMAELDQTGELNVGITLRGVAIFRLSAFKQRGSVAAVFRHIPSTIPALDTLNVPDVLAELVVQKRGLIILAGATGTGKSTTLAAMLEHRNQCMTGHILTIEDPMEFLFTNKKSIVNQREIGRDTASLQVGLRNALRQAPDCILVGEIRDRETMTAAISYALSGHLVLSTLHANNSAHALSRILSFYAPEARPALLNDLASGMKAIVSQRLLQRLDGGRVPAVEVLLNSQYVGEMLERGDMSGIKESMEKSMAQGSQTFEQDIARLIESGVVSREEGLVNSDSPTNLMWRLQNERAHGSKTGPSPDEHDEGPSFTDITLEVHSHERSAGALRP